jgi:DNA-directed RNA polymerase subunit RPC12/RpoP
MVANLESNRLDITMVLVCPRCGGEKKTTVGIYCQPCGSTIACRKRSPNNSFYVRKKTIGIHNYSVKKHITLPKIWK